jgi:hypothetical protein
MDFLGGVEPDMGGHHGHQQTSGRSQTPYAHTLALEVGDRTDTFRAEQFVATDKNASDQRDLSARVNRRNVIY